MVPSSSSSRAVLRSAVWLCIHATCSGSARNPDWRVGKNAGLTALTRIPCCPHSAARHRVSATTPALAAL